MHYLFLDTTNGLTLGLLNQNIDWISYQYTLEKRPSEVIHTRINELLNEKKINIEEIVLIVAAGPGSYTGMRLGEGIANIFQSCGRKVLSFYHYEIPNMLFIKEGKFVTNAFKGQFFVYEWSGEKSGQYLISANDLDLSKNYYTNAEDKNLKQTILTSNLIYEEAKIIFKKVIDRDKYFPSFYFRPLEDEFKTIC